MIEVDPADTSVIGAINHARRRGTRSCQGGGLVLSLREDWVCLNGRGCGRR
ncbi:hypothetical protein MPNT_80008 [Candidatus Methylacidithermus pantelleriae]|uniref:Uncharacterized protein n=1 Tax=Candidatus Methylacidithermus pantelleriae TaxID=2744239 RepID=A0A8J2FUV4_9BACT|nr:hypothetical protein MPNT_80008 [Candidatus Methylacidithermus pantelleriae]